MTPPRPRRPLPTPPLKQALQSGLAIPAHPLALTARRRPDERRQRSLTRYYAAAGAGGIAGLHEVLRRQGLLQGIWCLNPRETLSRGQAREIDRVYAAYPHLNDDAFVRQHLDQWLR